MTVAELLPSTLAVTPETAARLDTYVNLLCAWNKVLNLAGTSDKAHLVEDLILDSFYLAQFMGRLFANPEAEAQVWDLGAGAGLPGLPLRLLWSQAQYYLVESRQKRALFLRKAVLDLGLANTYVYNGRAEKFFVENQEVSPMCILSRAFMPWQKLLDFCGAALKKGVLIIMANEAPQPLPEGWTLLDNLAYQAGPRGRWLWALTQAA